jgi:hypothetical protein
MMKNILVSLCMFLALWAKAQDRTENVIVITLDGMRWQEVFGGIDSSLMNNKDFSGNPKALKEKYWSDNIKERREKLFPFLWNTIAKEGQLYGNRWAGNKVDVTNRYRFSYPGYNEIFTGYPDTAVNSNNKVWNENINVLEFINKQKGYEGKVAAFATWDVFPYILNKQRSGIYVNADFDSLTFETPEFKMFDASLIMMEEVTKAYCEDDTKLARSIFAKDEQLNEINRNASHIAEEYIKANLDRIQQALLIVSIIRKLERVGDHITNIAEEVIFFKEAKVLKHINKKSNEE